MLLKVHSWVLFFAKEQQWTLKIYTRKKQHRGQALWPEDQSEASLVTPSVARPHALVGDCSDSSLTHFLLMSLGSPADSFAELNQGGAYSPDS